MAIASEKELRSRLLALPLAKRRKLALDLYDSCAPIKSYDDRELAALIERRMENVRTGKTKLIPWKTVIREVRRELGLTRRQK